ICPTYNGSTTLAPVASEAGRSGQNGNAAGGIAGWDVYHQRFTCAGYDSYGYVEGEPGTDGATGTHGASGVGCDDFVGTVVGGFFVPSVGGNGTSGGHGGGGGGGGSGAGAFVHTSCFSKGFGYDNL